MNTTHSNLALLWPHYTKIRGAWLTGTTLGPVKEKEKHRYRYRSGYKKNEKNS